MMTVANEKDANVGVAIVSKSTAIAFIREISVAMTVDATTVRTNLIRQATIMQVQKKEHRLKKWSYQLLVRIKV